MPEIAAREPQARPNRPAVGPRSKPDFDRRPQCVGAPAWRSVYEKLVACDAIEDRLDRKVTQDELFFGGHATPDKPEPPPRNTEKG